ncbi:MAG: vWA domain-containing protein [Bacteroidia bacterium]
MAKIILIILLTLSFLSFTNNTAPVKKRKEVVFCLDLSGSTNGLINEIRDNLWRFINFTYRTNPGADLRIGIVVYGRPSFGAQNDYVKILSDLTDNYDYLSSELSKLKPNIEAGEQRMPSAIYSACKNLSWSNETNSKKIIFLFGNGIVPISNNNFNKACKIAEQNNIAIFPVYCIQKKIILREMPGYKILADRTGGRFNTFSLSQRSPSYRLSIQAETLKKLNDNLNSTYIYYSKDGDDRYNMMLNAEQNLTMFDELYLYSRCMYKVSESYEQKCATWDIISLMKLYMPDLTAVNPAYLPKDFQQLSPQQLYEKTMRIKQKRNKIISDIKIFYSKLNLNDTMNINPIDTIVLSQLR